MFLILLCLCRAKDQGFWYVCSTNKCKDTFSLNGPMLSFVSMMCVQAISMMCVQAIRIFSRYILRWECEVKIIASSNDWHYILKGPTIHCIVCPCGLEPPPLKLEFKIYPSKLWILLKLRQLLMWILSYHKRCLAPILGLQSIYVIYTS